MKIPREGQLLRVFVGESDRWKGKPLFEAIIQETRDRPPPEEDDPRRRYYRITERGRETVSAEAGRLDRVVLAAREKDLLPAER